MIKETIILTIKKFCESIPDFIGYYDNPETTKNPRLTYDHPFLKIINKSPILQSNENQNGKDTDKI